MIARRRWDVDDDILLLKNDSASVADLARLLNRTVPAIRLRASPLQIRRWDRVRINRRIEELHEQGLLDTELGLTPQ